MKNNQEKKINNDLIARPPIVVVLGHIDHGKTKLLDAIRETEIVQQEIGGITQSIGAYEVNFQGKKITFIDTPGHEAFMTMRSYGAKVADLAILVVAGDEGPKEQTWESVRIIKEADIPFLVALNKIDKPGCDVLKTKKQLAEGGVYLEGYGGDIPCLEVSAKEKKGIDDLLELIILMSEMLELKANPNNLARGFVVDSFLDKKRGNSASLVIKDGTLRQGELIATPSSFGKIRILEDCWQKPIREASFSSPVLVVGFENLPKIGEEFLVSQNKDDLLRFQEEKKEKEEEGERKKIIEEKETKLPFFKLILKSDTFGSLEALARVVLDIKEKYKEKVVLEIIAKGIGEVSESDLKMATSLTAQPLILAFKVGEGKNIGFLLEKEKIPLIKNDLIYKIKEDVEDFIKKSLAEKEKIYLGQLKVLEIFSSTKKKKLIGGEVFEGEIKNNSSFLVFREEEEIGRGKILSLKKEKMPVDSVSAGNLCGLLIECHTEIQKGDIIKTIKRV